MPDPLERLKGQRIDFALRVDDKGKPDTDGDGIALVMEDGSRCEFVGLGYDGLWQYVLCGWDDE